MSDPSEVYECGLCGRNGLPPEECEKCHGKAEVVARQFTLSEVRRKEDAALKSVERDVNPRIVKMPGS